MPVPARPTPSDDIEDRDPGLARERTDLAWTRTAISFIALGTAMVRTNAIAGMLVIAAGAAVWFMGHLSARSARSAGGADRRPGRRRTVQLITVATTVTAIVALASALLAP